MLERSVLETINRQRQASGFLTIEELLETNNIIHDPFSTLISRNVLLGQGNTFYPNVVLQTLEQGRLSIGNNNTFTPNCFFCTSGKITLGNHNLFGDGGVTARVNADEILKFGDNGRYINSPAFTRDNTLGDGSQVIGPIRSRTELCA